MRKILTSFLIFFFPAFLAAQAPATKTVQKTLSGNLITEDLNIGTSRTLRVASGGTFNYAAGASITGDTSELRTDLGLGNVENVALSTWTGGTGITSLGTVTTGTWNASPITNAYLDNDAITIAGTSVVLGGSITASSILDSIGSTRGSVLYRGASGWAILTPGTSGHFLKTNGAGADPAWTAVPGGGDALTSNPLSQFASTTSSQLRGVISDESGTGALIFAGGDIGAATATSLNGLTVSTTTGTLTVTNAKTLTISNSLTFAGTDGSTLNIGTGGTLGSAAFSATSAFQPASSNLTTLASNDGSALTSLNGSNISTGTVADARLSANVTLLGSSISLTSEVTGVLPKANGGTGASGIPDAIVVACSDETSAVTTGNAKIAFRMPFAATLTGVRVSLTTAPSGSNFIVDVRENGTAVLSTRASVDDGEKTSTTAVTPPVISDSSLADDSEITIDFFSVGSSFSGAGVKVTLLITR